MWQAYAGLAAYQVASGIQQAEIVRKNAELTRQVNDLNAEYAELDAYKAEVQGYSQEARYQTVIDSVLGQQRTGFAAQDVDVSFGTAKEVQAETKVTGFLNLLDIKQQAQARARGYKTQARNFRLASVTQSAQAALEAGAIQSSSFMRAGESGLKSYASYKGVTGYDNRNIPGERTAVE